MLSKIARTYSDKFSKFIVFYLAKLGIPPNLLSILGLLFSLFAGVLIILGYLKTGAILLILAGTADILDGSLAKSTNKQSKFGAYLDSVMDRYSDMIILLSLLLFFLRKDYNNTIIMLCCGVLCGFFLVSYSKARAESLISFPQGVGLMERPERLLFLIVGILLDKLYITLWLLLFLTHFTAIHRIWYTYYKLRKP